MINFGDDITFIKNYQELKSSRKMGQLYNCDKSSIINHAKKIGYDYSNNKEIKISKIPIKEVIQKYEELQSLKQVGEYYGCSGTAVRNYLIKNNYSNIENKKEKFKNVTQEEFIKNCEKNEYNTLKIAKLYNCSTTSVLNYCKKINYNLESKRKKTLSEEDKKIIINSYEEETSTKLAKNYKVSRGIITKIWYDNNKIGKDNKKIKNSYIDLSGRTFGLWTVLYKTNQRDAGGNIKWHCRCKCGIERDVSSNSLRNGLSLSCGNHSNISKGNDKIKNLLQEANIPFEIEYKFNSCKDKKPLPFDFYVNNSYLIEYDGIQHFQKNNFFNYEYTHKHDIIKNKWCKDNNIPLIRIPYTHYDNLEIKDLLLNSSQFLII